MSEEICSAQRSPWLMNAHDTVLLVIDLQIKLVPLVQSSNSLLDQVERLVEAAGILKLPVVVTEQYPQGLGSTLPGLAEKLPTPISKVSFSCCGASEVVTSLAQLKRRKIAVCGIETHVCVQQTVLDLISAGYDVYVPVDAVSARHELDHQTALKRMAHCGATLTTTESAMFEWTREAGTPEFKNISTIVRRPRQS